MQYTMVSESYVLDGLNSPNFCLFSDLCFLYCPIIASRRWQCRAIPSERTEEGEGSAESLVVM